MPNVPQTPLPASKGVPRKYVYSGGGILVAFALAATVYGCNSRSKPAPQSLQATAPAAPPPAAPPVAQVEQPCPPLAPASPANAQKSLVKKTVRVVKAPEKPVASPETAEGATPLRHYLKFDGVKNMPDPTTPSPPAKPVVATDDGNKGSGEGNTAPRQPVGQGLPLAVKYYAVPVFENYPYGWWLFNANIGYFHREGGREIVYRGSPIGKPGSPIGPGGSPIGIGGSPIGTPKPPIGPVRSATGTTTSATGTTTSATGTTTSATGVTTSPLQHPNPGLRRPQVAGQQYKQPTFLGQRQPSIAMRPNTYTSPTRMSGAGRSAPRQK